MKRLKTCIISVATATSITGNIAVAGELNVLTWEGYADASFVKPFEEKSGCKVQATYVGSNDDYAAKLAAGGGVYDLVSPSMDTTTTLIEAGFVQPVDTTRISNWNDLYAKFRNAASFNYEGEQYGVPFAWGAISFMYRTDKFDTPPTSIADLWNPDIAGKVSLWDDKSAVYVAARLNGENDIYKLSDEQLEKAKAKLIEQKPLVRKYWTTAGELIDLYAAGEVWVSNTWAGNQSAALIEKGIPVKEFIPKEGAEGWIDSFMVVKDTQNLDCAYKFLSMLVGDSGQCGVAKVTGYSVSNPVAAKKCMSPERFKQLHQDDLGYLNELILWEHLGDRFGAYNDAWNAVKAQ